jgi:putative SOS response-associated peptidase YedK
MCGRYAFDHIKDIYEARKILDEISSRLGRETAGSVKTGEIFPSERAAVLVQNENGYAADVMEWGYPLKDTRLVINARSESAERTPMFSKSLANRKCLIPCTGYFEWKPNGKVKEKYKIKTEGERLFYLAGLYDTFNIGNTEKKRFVILTREADPRIREIHARMPVIVKQDDIRKWLFEGYGQGIIDGLLNGKEYLSAVLASGV